MSSFEIGLLTILIFFCGFTVVNRICTCIETCTKAKAAASRFDKEESIEVFKDESGEKENC